jgi:hypothetical protein
MVVTPELVWAQLTDFDRQEFTFDNALAKSNPGFESGKTKWTASGGTFNLSSAAQIVPNSKQFALWNSNAAAQTFQTEAVTVAKTGNCEFAIWIAVPSGVATHTITVTDGTTDLVTPVTISTNVNALKHIVNFPCPASGTVRGKLTSVAADEPEIRLDNGRLGVASNVGNVAQALHKGSIRMTGCTDWSRSNGTFGSFTATAGCSYTTSGDVLAPSTFIPGFRLQNVSSGRYLIMARGSWYKTVTTTNADGYLRFNDGTNSFGEQAVFGPASSSGQSLTSSSNLSAAITYSTAQPTLTIQLQGLVTNTASATAINIDDDGGSNADNIYTEGLQFDVYYFPTSLQTVLNANDAMDLTGMMFYTGSATCPANTLPADGAAVSRTTYLKLFQRIGTTFGVGDGSTTFNVPDGRGIFIRGTGSQTYSSNTYTGVLGTKSTDRFESHTHTQDPHSHLYIASTVGGGFGAAGLSGTSPYNGTGTQATTATNQATGGTETNPANIGMTPCIAIAPSQQAYLANSVSTSLAGGVRIESAKLTTTTGPNACAITSQIGSWLTGTPSSSGAGQCSFAITSGIFSSAPNCSFNVFSGGAAITATGNASSATAATFQIWDAAGAGTTGGVVATCIGQR